MSKKKLPILYNNLLYKLGNYTTWTLSSIENRSRLFGQTGFYINDPFNFQLTLH